MANHAQLNLNDGVLFISLLYSAVDIQFEWEGFGRCSSPVHRWLLVSYVIVLTIRLMPLVGMQFAAANAGDFLMNLRQKEFVPRMLVYFMWLIVLPGFAGWTLLGSWWLRDVMTRTPNCLPTGAHTCFIVFFQALSYLWILIHAALGCMAWLLERRLRKTETDYNQVADADVIARWGAGFGQMTGYMSLLDPNTESQGLTPTEIEALPEAEEWIGVSGSAESLDDIVEHECSICLNDVKVGERVRRLCGCGHVFHKSCVDLWLLRHANCPLCKRDVKAGALQA